MNDAAASPSTEELVPPEVMPPGQLPPMRYKDLPPPVSLRKMIGPSIILAGLALGSGEFILWPYITYKSQFVFFWACVLGVCTQYFLNMEITRWSLATGESAITGFVRLNRHWAWVFLVLNVIPWMIPAWATGAAQILSWLIWEPTLTFNAEQQVSEIGNEPMVVPLAIGGMFLCGLILTAGPVIYETVERIQIFLVSVVILLIVVLAVLLVRPDAVVAQLTSTAAFGAPQFIPDESTTGLGPVLLLGALAFAGAGGTMNLGQSNYVKDKGYGMGAHIGRITSPLTGQVEAVAEIGYHFPHTAENMARWKAWWRAASLEHLLSFFATCLICLVLLTLIAYSIFHTPDGALREGAERYGKDMNFVLGEAQEINSSLGAVPRLMFLVMGIAVLLTTEFGVLDAATRISTDIVKVSWLRNNATWSESRLYYVFLWGTILLGSLILVLKAGDVIDIGAFGLFKLTAAMNGGVMFIYSGLLLYVNRFKLPPAVRMSWWRALIMVWSTIFFGVFAVWAGYSTLAPMFVD